MDDLLAQEMNPLLRKHHGVILTKCHWLFQGWISKESNIPCIRLLAAVQENTVLA